MEQNHKFLFNLGRVEHLSFGTKNGKNKIGPQTAYKPSPTPPLLPIQRLPCSLASRIYQLSLSIISFSGRINFVQTNLHDNLCHRFGFPLFLFRKCEWFSTISVLFFGDVRKTIDLFEHTCYFVCLNSCALTIQLSSIGRIDSPARRWHTSFGLHPRGSWKWLQISEFYSGNSCMRQGTQTYSRRRFGRQRSHS